MNPNLLDAMVLKGILISVTVRYWRARKKLKPEDLGLSDDQINDRLISLGHKRLVPRDCLKELALIEGRAHACVEENTFPFLNGVARYLPNPKLENVTAKLESLKHDFESARQDFLSRYADFRREALQEWRETAIRLANDPERTAAVIEGAFPSPDAMEHHFGFHVNLFQVAVPNVPTGELVALGTQREVIAAREDAVRSARQEIDSSCREFIADCTATLREQTAALCSDMLETISSTGSVHQKTLNRLVKFIDHFRELNFVNDTEMETQLEQVRDEFLQRSAGEYRDSDPARRGLVKGLTALRQSAAQMAEADTRSVVESFGQVGRRRFSLAA